LVFNPSATKPGLSNRLWEIEQPAAAAANGYFVAANNRIGREVEEFGEEAVTFYGSSYFADPRGNFVGDHASPDAEEVLIRDLDLDEITRARNDWQFYRDRRPDSYTRISAP
jgi:N-carbamoylputrescine amidase